MYGNGTEWYGNRFSQNEKTFMKFHTSHGKECDSGNE